MQLNVSTNYAITMMLHLAKSKRVVSSTELSRSVAVSKRYLLQIASRLRDGELIGVSMGSNGGYYLLSEPSRINLYDIILQMEGEVRILGGNGNDESNQIVSLAFADLQRRIGHYLSSLTLDILINSSWPECLRIVDESLAPYYESLRTTIK